MAKLAMDPSTRGYLSQPDFMQMLQLLQKNPQMMSNFMQDQRFSHALSVSPLPRFQAGSVLPTLNKTTPTLSCFLTPH